MDYFVEESLDPKELLGFPIEIEKITTSTKHQKYTNNTQKVHEYQQKKTQTQSKVVDSKPKPKPKDPTWADIKPPIPPKSQPDPPKSKPKAKDEIQVFRDVKIEEWGSKKRGPVSAFDDLIKLEKKENKSIVVSTPAPPKRFMPEEKKPPASFGVPISKIAIPEPSAQIVGSNVVSTKQRPRDPPMDVHKPMIICMRPVLN